MSATVTADAVVERRDVAVSTVPTDRPRGRRHAVTRCGGISGLLRADGLCQAYGGPFSPY